jgi:7,8-dihydroneopterin 2',3'-cyclic phosphate phosphodiesterase
MPTRDDDKEKSCKAILGLVNNIQDEALRRKVINLLEDPTVTIGDTTFQGIPLAQSPASKRLHHSYPRGLLQHMEAVTTIGLALSEMVEKIYGAKVSRDVVIAAAIVHDIMKPLTYTKENTGESRDQEGEEMKEEYEIYTTSPLGERLDHLSLAVAELIRRGFPLEVVHAVAAHHGRGGPMDPRTIEALICSLSDSADASLNGEALTAANNLIQNCTGGDARRLFAQEAFAIIRAKQDSGCPGVIEEYEKIKARRPGKP